MNVVRLALEHPPRRPDPWGTFACVALNVALIAKIVAGDHVGLSDCAILCGASGASVAMLMRYAWARRRDPLQEYAKGYIKALQAQHDTRGAEPDDLDD